MAIPQTHFFFLEEKAMVNQIPVDLERPENNGGVLIFLIDHKIGGTLHKCVLICKERVHPADFQSSKFKARLVSPNIVDILEPTIHAPFLDVGGGQQQKLLNMLVRRGVIDDQGEQDMKIQLNAIIKKKARQEKFLRLVFPKSVHLSNHLFSAGSDDKIKPKSITYPVDIELAPNTDRAVTHKSLEMFVFWKIVMVEESQRVIDGASTNEELDDILDSMPGTNLF
jgi:hypothetical protein